MKGIGLIPLGLQSTALSGAEILINRALRYDPATRRRLAQLDGRVMRIEITGPDISIHLACQGDQVSLRRAADGEPDVSLKGSAPALAGVALQGEKAIAGSGLAVRGNLELLQRFRNILAGLDLDWEAALAQLTGELPAHLIARAARSAHRWQQQARPRAVETAVNFICHEARLTPARAEMAQWRSDVRKLSSDLERIAARLNRLQTTIPQQMDDQT